MQITKIKAECFCISIEKALASPPDVTVSINRIGKTLNALPTGKLYLSNQGRVINFRTAVNDKLQYLPKHSILLYSLARRRYQSSLLEILKLTGSTRERDRARRARLIADMQHFIRTCERGNLDIAKIVLTGSQYKWFTGAFRQKQIDKAKATQTAGGLFVRSIAEREIINKYDEYAVPLHYEEQLVVNVQPLIDGLYGELIDSGFLGRGAGIERLYDYRGGRIHWNVPAELETMNAPGSIWKTYYPPRGTITMHPDIKTIFADGSVFLHEHEGMMSKFIYRNNASERSAILKYTGTIRPENFLETYEHDIDTPDKRAAVVERHVLPRLWF